MDILENCELERNEHPFKATKVGIFIFTEPKHDIKELLDDHDLTLDSWPALISFTGCYSLQHFNMKMSGCLNLKDLVYTSKVDTKMVEDFVVTTLAEQVQEYVSNIPMMIALILLPAATVTTMCILKQTYKSCKPKEQYRRSRPTRVPLMPLPSRVPTKNQNKRSNINLE